MKDYKRYIEFTRESCKTIIENASKSNEMAIKDWKILEDYYRTGKKDGTNLFKKLLKANDIKMVKESSTLSYGCGEMGIERLHEVMKNSKNKEEGKK